MKRIKVGLNGFGRIGRAVTRIAFERDTFDIVAINTRKTPPDMLAYLLQYDSVYRRFNKEVKAVEEGITIGGKKVPATMVADVSAIPWDQYGVDVVIDATGAFTKKEDLMKHVRGSVKKVLLTAPAKDKETTHVVLGVNDDTIDWKKRAGDIERLMHDKLRGSHVQGNREGIRRRNGISDYRTRIHRNAVTA
jgi:glyceraldehyde 3-phosphate dehydrogenase